MDTLLLVTGGSGFIGQAVLSQKAAHEGVAISALDRRTAVETLWHARKEAPDRSIALLNLAWPSLRQYSSNSGASEGVDEEWTAFCVWIDQIAEACAENNIRFFQTGSGVEPYALGDNPLLGEPYLTYAKRKKVIWETINAAPNIRAWRLRIHFVFGPGEAAKRYVPAAIEACINDEAITTGAPERLRSWIYVDDLAAGLIKAATSPAPQHWDITPGRTVSFTHLNSLIERAVGGKLNVTPAASPPADAGCPEIAPELVFPELPTEIGGDSYYVDRLSGYSTFLKPRSG